MKTRTLISLLWIFALAFWNLHVWQGLFESRRDMLTVAFLNIGQGDAIFIEAPNGMQMLIDGGEDKDILAELKAVMPKFDTYIDIVLATHPDSDHIGGLDDVLKEYEVRTIVDNGRDDKETSTFDQLESEIKNEISVFHAQRVLAENGKRILLDSEKNIYFDIYFPSASSTSKDSNELSVVGKLVYGETAFMFTGDAGVEVENKLIAWCVECLESDVLKVGHHGSKTSTGQPFLDAVNPRYAIISAGKNNTYGHPHKDVMKRLEEKEIEILETAQSGTIIFESDGGEVRLR